MTKPSGIPVPRASDAFDPESEPDSADENGETRTGTALILATRPFASDAPARSWWYVLSTASLLAASVAGTLLLPYLMAQIAASILTGLLILRLFVIYHDQQHHAILSRSPLAEVLMRFIGVLALSPSSV